MKYSPKFGECYSLWVSVDLIFGKVFGFGLGRKLTKKVRSLAADQAHADDGLWHGHAEGPRELDSINKASCNKDPCHIMRISELPTQTLFSEAPS